ncbi:MAG TPA: hypothetical protein VMD27_01260 [Candidatus Aquilonibacter sp.]|nr:hypothetical protein [Candidatus Aquilonibacter sp.]
MSLNVPFFGRETGFEKSISGGEIFFVTGALSAMVSSIIKLPHCVVETRRGQTFFGREFSLCANGAEKLG